jgi:predicted transcriptional regulator
MGDDSAPKDLFGDPFTPPRDPRGRKSHKRLPQLAERIALYRATGKTIEEIEALVFLSAPTLRKYYFRELENGATMVEAVLDAKIFEKAMAGTVGAMRLLKDQLEKGKAAVPVGRKGAARAPRAPKEERLGKKAQAEVDAKGAHKGTSWGDILN